MEAFSEAIMATLLGVMTYHISPYINKIMGFDIALTNNFLPAHFGGIE